MNIVVITNEALKQELLMQSPALLPEIDFITDLEQVKDADCYIDLLFEPFEERIQLLKALRPALILVNEVVTTLNDLPDGFVRLNGWPGLLQRPLVEACAKDAETKQRVEELFNAIGKKTEWVSDIPGFISARVLGMIINEAYFSLEEKVSSKDEIDTAMKLGTNYPFGPFEWGQRIGLQRINHLLTTLAKSESRYAPSSLLTGESL